MKHILTALALILCLALTSQAKNRIVVSKKNLTLCVYDDKNTLLFKAPVSVGINKGQKTRKGDHRTPEGSFKVGSIEASSGWTWDFHDGKGKRKGAYGPWFFRLRTPISTMIGIHGTCFPEQVGTRSSHGCIRLCNEDLLRLKPLVQVGMICTIEPD